MADHGEAGDRRTTEVVLTTTGFVLGRDDRDGRGPRGVAFLTNWHWAVVLPGAPSYGAI